MEQDKLYRTIMSAAALVLLALIPANLIWIYIIYWGTLPRSIAPMGQASATDVAELPVVGGTILVMISVTLTLIAGLIPSRVAAKKDPVEALRTE